VLIDLEMLLQPVARGVRTNAPRPAGPRTADGDTDADTESCLTTGLVTLVESTAGQMFDIGGLRGTGEGASSVTTRVWHGFDTIDLHYTDEKSFSTRVKNQVRLDGVLQSPETYADDLLAGFDAAYAVLLAAREALLAPDGPIAAFGPVPVRLLPRPTAQYASLAYLLARPQYQKDGCRWSAAMDALNRFVSQAHDQPEIWPVLVAERRALEGLDIPHFTALASEAAVRSGSRLLIEHYYGQSGLDAVRARIQALSEADAAGQRERLRLALHESIHTRFATEPQHADATELDVTSPDFLIDHAIWIARELLVRAEIGPAGLTWTRAGVAPPASISRRHHLYDGSLGPALFLAATAVVSTDDRWRAAALDVVSGIAADLDAVLVDPDDIGVASGLGSIVYGLTIVGTLLGDETTLALAARAASGLTPDRIAQDRGLDLVAGAAGAALGLLALYKATRDARFLDLAVCCGDRLLATATPAPPGLAWRIADGRAFTGFAHGAAGIAYALGRLFDACGEKRFGRASTEGYRYVASRFIEGVANWPILGEPAEGTPAQGATMTAWCHGAPGITLAISLGSADSVDPHLLDQLEPALKTTAAASPHKADHVCCGNVGRCEALFTTGRRLMRREAIEGGRRLARVVIARARAAGHFCLSANGYEYRMFDPGFFRGLSGIGYSLLRLASPSHLPSIAAFEAPPSGVRPGSRR
jgi:type 2 lantibiotic biosynthesis protein LanM